MFLPKRRTTEPSHKISGFQSNECLDYSFISCDNMQYYRWIIVFQKKWLLSFACQFNPWRWRQYSHQIYVYPHPRLCTVTSHTTAISTQ